MLALDEHRHPFMEALPVEQDLGDDQDQASVGGGGSLLAIATTQGQYRDREKDRKEPWNGVGS